MRTIRTTRTKTERLVTVSEVAIPNLGQLLVGGADRLLPEVASP